MSLSPAEFWRGNSRLRDITPRGERFPEAGLFDALRRACRGSVFEFGCGDGRLAPAFPADGYAGFDINPAALAAAAGANPGYSFGDAWQPADTWLAWTVLLHVPDDEIAPLLARTAGYGRLVIGEVMGRRWRRDGFPPVFNREPHEYVALVGRELIETIAVPYPRYACDLTVMVFE